jgi:hypothetical protein
VHIQTACTKARMFHVAEPSYSAVCVLQELAKGTRKSIKARQTNKAKEDPDFRVKGGNSQKIKKSLAMMRAQKEAARGSSSGGGAAGSGGGAAAEGAKKTKQQRAKEIAQGWAAGPSELGGLSGMNPAAAAAGMGAQYGPGALQGYPSTSRSSFLEGGGSGELFSPTSAGSQQYPQQFPGQHQHHHHPQQYPGHAGCDASMHDALADPQQQQWPGHDMAAAVGGGGGYRAAAAAGDRRGSRSGGMQGDNKGALKHLLRQAGDQPPGVLAGNSKHTASEAPELSYQLLLAAAGFDAGPDGGPVWPGQRGSVAGQSGDHQSCGRKQAYHQQQEQQQGSMLAASGPSIPSIQRLPGGMQAAAAGGQHTTGMPLGTGLPAAAAGAAAGAAGSSLAKAGNLGRSISGASSADSAPNNAHQAGRLMRPQQQQQQGPYSTAAGPGGDVGQFRYTSGVLVGPGGPEQPGKQHKLLDLNVLARTGRMQLSHGLIRTAATEPAPRPSYAAQQQQHNEQQQQQEPHLQALQGAAAAPGSSACDPSVLEKIAAAMKAVTEARGDQEQQDAFASAAAMIAQAAAATQQGSGGASRGAADGYMPMSGPGSGGPIKHEYMGQHEGGGGPTGLHPAAAGSLQQGLGGLQQQGPGFKASRDPRLGHMDQVGQAQPVEASRGLGAGQGSGGGQGASGGSAFNELGDMLVKLLQGQAQGR